MPAHTTLKLPGGQTYETTEDTTLGAVAASQLGKEGKAALLLGLNLEHLIQVPAKTSLKLPAEEGKEAKPFVMPRAGDLATATRLALPATVDANATPEQQAGALSAKARNCTT